MDIEDPAADWSTRQPERWATLYAKEESMMHFDRRDADCNCIRRRTLLAGAGALVGLTLSGLSSGGALAQVMTKEQRDSMTPDQIIDLMKAGNERFKAGTMKNRDYVAKLQTTAAGQYPVAVLLSCIDSRAPAEIVLDMGLGDVFNSRIAGNVADVDVLGGMEFACKLAGAKVVLIMGHTACGAVAGTIAGAELGNLTALLSKIKPAVEKTSFDGDRSASNPKFVDAVARTNVSLMMAAIRADSPVLAEMEKQGSIKIVGSMYDLKSGSVEFFA
jgi:carbonic anhydrase